MFITDIYIAAVTQFKGALHDFYINYFFRAPTNVTLFLDCIAFSQCIDYVMKQLIY